MIDPKIIVAIDTYDYKKAIALLDQLNPALCKVKIGSVAFNAFGKGFLRLVDRCGSVSYTHLTLPTKRIV